MASGLAIENVVDISVQFTPVATPTRDFGTLLLIGSSDVIPVASRIRYYTTLSGVAADFGTSAPEYTAASLFFAQSPQPSQLYIGRWAQSASKGVLTGGNIGSSSQAALLATMQAITNGSFTVTIGGVLRTVTSLNFSANVTLSEVAATINTAVSVYATCSWDATNGSFVLKSVGTGATNGAITYANVAGGGTDVVVPLKWNAATGAQLSQGVAAEDAVDGLNALAAFSSAWYACMFACSTPPSDADYTECAAFIEAANPVRIIGFTTQDTNTLVLGNTDNLAYDLKQLTYRRSYVQYSSSSLYAVASALAKGLTVDFTANNSTITLKFKTEPGVTAETLTETQAQAVTSMNANIYVNYINATAIIQQGVMSNGLFFDEVHGTDWFANAIQTAVYNLLYTSPTKIPQTNYGVNQIVNVIDGVCAAAVNNGLIAPGLWTGPTIGPVKQNTLLPTGFFVYVPNISEQSQADREARIAPTCQVLAKLGGAVHFADVLVNVNR